MKFRMIFTTVDVVTTERDSLEDAQARAAEIERYYNSHHHHGEKTTVVVEPVEGSS